MRQAWHDISLAELFTLRGKHSAEGFTPRLFDYYGPVIKLLNGEIL
jgi:hypothetical protein